MDPLAVTASTTGSATTPVSASPAPSSTAAETTAPKKSFATLFAEAKKDLKTGERLDKVTGHPFARIKGGERDEMCVNLSGNVRSGQAFDLITRGAHTFHVYGTGKDRVIVEVGHKDAAQQDSSATTKTQDATTGGAKAKNTK